MARKYGPSYGKKAKAEIKKQIASGEIIAVKPVRVRKSKVSKTVKDYVNNAIDKQAEDKHYLKSVFANQDCKKGGFDSTLTDTGLTTTSSIIPYPTQGTGSSNRVGNRLNVKSLIVRMHMEAKPIVATTNPAYGLPFYVRVVFYNRKDSATNWTNDTILQLGNSITSFTYQTESLLLQYNKDTYNIIKSFTVKMSPSQALDVNGVSSQVDTPNGFMSHYIKSFRLKCPKRLIFDDTTLQANQKIFCAIGVVNADGSVPFASGSNVACRLQVSMDTHLIYEDL